MLLLSLLSFDANDPSLNHVVSGVVKVKNKAGLFGAYTAGFLNDVFGVAAYLCPLVFGALGAAYVSPSYSLHWSRWLGFFLLTVCLLVIGSASDITLGDMWGGGMVGNALHLNASRYLSPGGSALVWIFVALVGMQLAGNISWFNVAARVLHWAQARLAARAGNATGPVVAESQPESEDGKRRWSLLDLRLPSMEFWKRWRDRLGNIQPTADSLPDVFEEQKTKAARPQANEPAAPRPAAQVDADDPFAVAVDINGMPISPAVSAGAAYADERGGTAPAHDPAHDAAHDLAQDDTVHAASPAASAPNAGGKAASAAATAAEAPKKQGGLTGLLSGMTGRKAAIPLPGLELLAPPVKVPGNNNKEDREARGKALIACLKDFDIQSELVHVTPGPVVTMYEVRPAPGIRVSRIANLSDDLALALKAVAVRIQAPIPGTDTVGIEIPNDNRETVNFRELAASEPFRKGCGPLTMILGKDISGKPIMADLTRMPHLLVAGATGAGKSVCLNGILISLLYRTQPKDMQLLLVDPKRIEMAVYADEPHLVHPVVTEMNEAKNALDWAVHEMDRRYEAMARLGVRNVAGFNQKLAACKNDLPPDFADLEPLPYLVIVIDELADLMMTAAREVETSIVRLAQLARAAGIHMILATQRPSVDVVTGLIKANFPCRISFQVTSKHDSRTILDQVGAEHLLGRGDMLFKPSGGRLQRLHGPFLSDEEVQGVVAYWKRQLSPSYKVDFAQWGLDSVSGGGSGGGGDAAQDPLYGEVQAFVSEQGRASISLVQRRFKIGFNRAARLVEQLEHDGIIGPADGSKPRAVVK
ncbi:conserved membrane hypothetical protein [uncultured Desulfovibrio sp.]|uniref:FtsK domain-containing protein n=1 Tax=uncultured Desulfovibrio sp. TaxID=167968 RepID=A0A212KKI6_9BACT|nr:conserved membrane hypothetical protein [uncultured Desulfovibrio sp.]